MSTWVASTSRTQCGPCGSSPAITRYFKSPIGSPEWLAEYHKYEASDRNFIKNRHAPGTLGDLITRYYRSQDFNSQGEVSQAKNRAVIEEFREGRDDRPVGLLTFEHIDTILAKKAQKVTAGDANRATGGPAAAQRLRKQLRRLFEHAVRIGMIRTNPVELTARVKYKTAGFHTWTEEEIAKFRERHPVGTKVRLALEIILWTGQRRGDAHRFGPPQFARAASTTNRRRAGRNSGCPSRRSCERRSMPCRPSASRLSSSPRAESRSRKVASATGSEIGATKQCSSIARPTA